jgi:hypothetical protein
MVIFNTQSGFLHLEGHGEGKNTEEFDRADEADMFAHKSGMKMKFCSVCFPDNPNAESAGQTPAASPSEFTTDAGTTPATLTTGTSSNPAS